MAQRYSQYYLELVDEVVELAEARLERALGGSEQRAIRNAGSTVLLDTVRLRIATASSRGAVEHELHLLSMMGEDRLKQTRMQLGNQLSNLLARELTASERSAIAELPTVDAALHVAEEIIETRPTQREARLRLLLAG